MSLTKDFFQFHVRSANALTAFVRLLCSFLIELLKMAILCLEWAKSQCTYSRLYRPKEVKIRELRVVPIRKEPQS